MKANTFSPDAAKKAAGPCPVCGETDLWLNGVPLKAFCWGTEEKEHPQWSKVVPAPHNPYLPK